MEIGDIVTVKSAVVDNCGNKFDSGTLFKVCNFIYARVSGEIKEAVRIEPLCANKKTEVEPVESSNLLEVAHDLMLQIHKDAQELSDAINRQHKYGKILSIPMFALSALIIFIITWSFLAYEISTVTGLLTAFLMTVLFILSGIGPENKKIIRSNAITCLLTMRSLRINNHGIGLKPVQVADLSSAEIEQQALDAYDRAIDIQQRIYKGKYPLDLGSFNLGKKNNEWKIYEEIANNTQENIRILEDFLNSHT